MKKMSTVFVVTYEVKGKGVISNEVRDVNRWVLDGEGVATIKFDGTSCLIEDGKVFKRYDRKLKKQFLKHKSKPDFVADASMFKDAPEGFIPCEPEPDRKTGHWPGWIEIDINSPNDKWHVEAIENLDVSIDSLENGTYELVGPKIGVNHYGLDRHEFWKHGSVVVDVEPTFEAIKAWLENNIEEGLVFHHPDGRMAKIRRKDFGLEWSTTPP